MLKGGEGIKLPRWSLEPLTEWGFWEQWEQHPDVGGGVGKQGSAQRNLEHRKALETVWRLKCQQCLGTASRTRWGAGKRPEAGVRDLESGLEAGRGCSRRGRGGHWGHLVVSGEIT